MTKGAASNFSFIEPMKALPVRDLPAGDWLYEMKFDGYRALAFKAEGGAAGNTQPNRFQ
jgi:ATP-dependent DNA ligase